MARSLVKGVLLNVNQPLASYPSHTSLGNPVTSGSGFQAGNFTRCNQSVGANAEGE